MDALVRIDEVRKRYESDGRPALDGVSLEIGSRGGRRDHGPVGER